MALTRREIIVAASAVVCVSAGPGALASTVADPVVDAAMTEVKTATAYRLFERIVMMRKAIVVRTDSAQKPQRLDAITSHINGEKTQ